MRKLFLVLLVLLFILPSVSAVCRYFAKDARGFPVGIQPSVSNISISVPQGNSSNTSFELTVSGDQSQGIRFYCAVSLEPSQPGNGITVFVEPSSFRTGGGFNKTVVSVAVSASPDAEDYDGTITISDDDKPDSFVILPIEVTVTNKSVKPSATTVATATPRPSSTQGPAAASATPTPQPTSPAPAIVLDDNTKYFALAGGIALLLGLLWFGFHSLHRD